MVSKHIEYSNFKIDIKSEFLNISVSERVFYFQFWDLCETKHNFRKKLFFFSERVKTDFY